MLAAFPCAANAAAVGTTTPDLSAYVKARAADAAGASEIAAAGYASALDAAPANTGIAMRAYREALSAGDDALAIRAAKTLEAGNAAPIDVALFECAVAARAGDNAALDAALVKLQGTPFAFVAGPIRAWQVFAAGKDPLPLLDVSRGNPIERRYTAENRALLLIALGRTDEGVAALQALLGADRASVDLRYNAAQLLAAARKTDTARALLVGDDPSLNALSAGLGAGVKPSLGFGVSRLFGRLGSDLSHGKAAILSIVINRSAVVAEPDNDRARLLLADALNEGGATDRALAMLDSVALGHPLHDLASDSRVQMLRDADQPERALAAARLRAQAPNADAGDARQLGELLIAADLYPQAADAFALALKRAGKSADWTYHLQLGGAYEQAGRWPEARAELERAVALAPDEPLALNYLGYARIEHGEEVAASEKLLERAHKLAPDNASITDSLAWAWFKRGDTMRALPMLEAAAMAEPANAAISEHLGDAYWAAGRCYEARYAWAAAKSTADAGDARRLTAKIATGPSAATAQR